MRKGPRKTRILKEHKPTVRQGACGWAYPREKRIEIDPRLSPREYLETLIHELLHCLAPGWSESKVEKAANEIADHVWASHFRKIEQ